jgi:hypothetical protein
MDDIIVADYWENQAYKLIKGGEWREPFVESLSLTNVGGNFSVDKETKDNCSDGWIWVDDEWKIDISGKFGSSDDEGWSYGPSFNTLFIHSKLKVLKGDRSPQYFFRRRRWIRRQKLDSSKEKVLLNRSILITFLHHVGKRMAIIASKNVSFPQESILAIISSYRIPHSNK